MIYIIPYKQRSTEIGKYNQKRTLMEVDGFGLFVSYDEGQELDVSNIRRHLIAMSDQKQAMVEADNPKQAFEKLYAEWDGFKTGTKVKAREISKREPIVEYPNCKDMVEMSGGRTGCAKGEWNGKLSPKKDSYCGCVIDGYVRPRNCPIANDRDIMSISYIMEQIDGYVFKRSSVRKNFGIKTRGLKDDKTNTMVFELYKKEVLKALTEQDPKKFDIKNLEKKVSNLQRIQSNMLNEDRYY